MNALLVNHATKPRERERERKKKRELVFFRHYIAMMSMVEVVRRARCEENLLNYTKSDNLPTNQRLNNMRIAKWNTRHYRTIKFI